MRKCQLLLGKRERVSDLKYSLKFIDQHNIQERPIKRGWVALVFWLDQWNFRAMYLGVWAAAKQRISTIRVRITLLVFSNSQQDYVNWRKEGVVVKGQIPRKLQESLGILHDWGCWIHYHGRSSWTVIYHRMKEAMDASWTMPLCSLSTTEVDYPTIANDWSAFPYFHYEVFLFE